MLLAPAMIHLLFRFYHFFLILLKLGHRMTWGAYHRLADINSYLDYLTVTYPDLCSVQTIGYSYERRPIKVLR